MLAAVEAQVHGVPGVAHALQTLLHGVAAQAVQRQNLAVPLLKQVAGGAFADQLMMRRDRREPHAAIHRIDQHAGLIDLRRKLVDMIVVDPDQQRGVGLLHLLQKQRRVALILLQRAVA